MIQLNNVSFSYSERPIFQNLNQSFESGRIHGIVGLNGSGKTTFFKLMAMHMLPDSGRIHFNQNPLKKSDTGFLETELYFYPKLTAREFLSVFPQQNKEYQELVLSEIFQLPIDELVTHYSTGMKKKLMLMTLIKQDAPIILLDEPFNGLDVDACQSLEIMIQILKEKGKTIFISSHILSSLTDVSDYIHYLHHQKIEKTFSKSEFVNIEKEIFGNQLEQLKNQLKEVI